MNHEKQGLDRYANTDPSLHYNGSVPQSGSDWFSEFIECLQRRDYEAAHLIRLRNDERYAEAEAARAAAVFPLRHAEIKLLREVQSERNEAA